MSSCCFQSPIIYLGSGQYWVNISVFESNPIGNNSFTVLFGSLYHFPLPIVIDQNQKPAPCRLDNPNDLDSGSMWTCTASEAHFRIDTNPKGVDPVIHQLSTTSSGECYGRPVCTSTVETRPNDANPGDKQEESSKVNLGALGTYDRGPVIAAFTLSSLVVVGLAALYWYRNRHRGDPPGNSRLRGQPPGPQDARSSTPGSCPERNTDKAATAKSTLLDSFTKTDKSKARRLANAKSLLAVMDEKSQKRSRSALLCVPNSSERQKSLVKNEIDDNESDKSNVPLAILYKN